MALNAGANESPHRRDLSPRASRLHCLVGDFVDKDLFFNLVDGLFIHGVDPLPSFHGWQLGHQFSCDCRNAHKDDEELEHRGVAAIWFDDVNSRKQEGGNDADAEGCK